MTPLEASDFDARAHADYITEPWLRWTSGPPAPF
jgi:hypothetical protein